MTITMNTIHIPTLKQMADFVSGTIAIDLHCSDSHEAYNYIERILTIHKYFKLTRRDKGIVRAYLVQVTGFGSAQITRLIRQHKRSGHIAKVSRTQPTFAGKYLS